MKTTSQLASPKFLLQSRYLPLLSKTHTSRPSYRDFFLACQLLLSLIVSGSACAADTHYITPGNLAWNQLPTGGFDNVLPGRNDRAIYDRAGTGSSYLLGGSRSAGQLVFLAPYGGSGAVNVPGNPNLEGTMTLFGLNGLGIDDQVNQQITLFRRLLISGSQEWRISSATGSISQLSAAAANNGLSLGSSTLTLNAVNAANFFQLNNVISGTGGIIVTGAGSVSFGAANTYTGATIINSGKLVLTAAGTLAQSSRVEVDGTLDISGMTAATASIALLSGSAGGQIVLGTKSLVLVNANDNFAGNISGSGGVALNGGKQIFSGNNTYTGSTTIAAGTLQLGNGGSAGSIAGDVTNNGTLIFNRANQLILASVISGTGDVRQSGSGITTLTANSGGFGGHTFIDAGTLSVNGRLGGAMAVNGGRLQGTGSVGDTSNFAGGTIAPGNSIGTLLIAGNYTGNGGSLEIEGRFAGAGSPADRLLITGNATGTTMIKTINVGGAGAVTGTGNTDGISIIQVAGNSASSTFQLAGGYAAAGPYQYQLRVFAPAASAASEADPRLGVPTFYDYRLQSLLGPGGAPVPVPQIAGYQALSTGAVRYGASLLDSVHRRQGELRELGVAREQNGATQNNEFFMRAQGSTNKVSGDRASAYSQDISFVQAGGNFFGRDLDNGAKWRIGGAFSFGESKLNADTSSAKVNLHGTTIALTSTYQVADGGYIDGIFQGTRYSSDITTSERGQTGTSKGWAYGLSLEGGYPLRLDSDMVIEPQIQLSYQKIRFDTFVDVDRITVDLQGGQSLRGRIGSRLQKTFTDNRNRFWTPFVEANLIHEFLGGGGVRADGVNFAADSLGTGVQFAGGINARIGLDKLFFASVGYEHGISGDAANSWSGNIGVRLSF